jgi:hypothetical protein
MPSCKLSDGTVVEQFFCGDADEKDPLEIPESPCGLVYFIEAIGAYRIKIGRTMKNEAGSRMRELATSSPFPLKLIGVLYNAELERSIHLMFSSERVHKEWFALSDRLLAFIRAMVSPNYHPTDKVIEFF